MPADCVGKRDVFVGRIRKDLDRANGFHLWVVSDNLLKAPLGTQSKSRKACKN
ncbi:Asd/ArgC dimerization domain-containing protein [Bacillus velezensis]|nr:Asd/ArgC dimerization domain-containing protein [Bacillus velezensis]